MIENIGLEGLTARRGLALACALACLVWVSAGGSALAQQTFEFKLGFQALAERIPTIAGQPVETERYGTNGDSLQRTTTGLMVWRKADNWTAFTDGSRTWINGPLGVQDRSNGERFAWEQGPVVPPAAPVRFYAPEVKAMDPEAGGHGVKVSALMAKVDSEWARAWGWRPTRPTTIYLYTDGYRMASSLPAIAGVALAPEQARDYSAGLAALHTRDVATGGWAVMVNVSYGTGDPGWESLTQATLVHQYAMLMMLDAAGSAGPTWYRQGLAYLSAYSQVPSAPSIQWGNQWLYDARDKGTLPTLGRLQRDWDGFTAVNAGYSMTARHYAYLAMSVLAERAEGPALLEVLRRASQGEDFEAALSAVTGYSLDQLDTEVRAKLR